MTRMIAALLMSLALMLTGTVTSAVADETDETEEMGDTRAGHVYLDAVCPANSATDRFYRVIWGTVRRSRSRKLAGAFRSSVASREPWAWQKRERRGSCSTLRRLAQRRGFARRENCRELFSLSYGFSPWGLLTRPSDGSAVGAAR